MRPRNAAHTSDSTDCEGSTGAAGEIVRNGAPQPPQAHKCTERYTQRARQRRQKSHGKEQDIAATHHTPNTQGKEQSRKSLSITGDEDGARGAERVHGERPQRDAVSTLIANECAGVEDAAVTPVQATDEEAVEHDRQSKAGGEADSDRGKAVLDTENVSDFTADH